MRSPYESPMCPSFLCHLQTHINEWVCTQNSLGTKYRVAGAGSVIRDQFWLMYTVAGVRGSLVMSLSVVKQLLRSCCLCGSDGGVAAERSGAAPRSECGERRRPVSWRLSGSGSGSWLKCSVRRCSRHWDGSAFWSSCSGPGWVWWA